MYHNFSSYNTFEIDISDYVYYDKENIIAVAFLVFYRVILVIDNGFSLIY